MVSFGLVTIPVKLYSTGETAVGIQLNMLHRKCGSRLKQQYVCPVDDVVVGRDEMVKGYEYAKGQYVLFTEDEIKALSREATNAMEITEFVPLEQVDPIYFERSYYLGPDKGGERPYRLLAEARLAFSAAIRSMIWAFGASTGAAVISWPDTFFSIMSMVCLRTSSSYASGSKRSLAIWSMICLASFSSGSRTSASPSGTSENGRSSSW